MSQKPNYIYHPDPYPYGEINVRRQVLSIVRLNCRPVGTVYISFDKKARRRRWIGAGAFIIE